MGITCTEIPGGKSGTTGEGPLAEFYFCQVDPLAVGGALDEVHGLAEELARAAIGFPQLARIGPHLVHVIRAETLGERDVRMIGVGLGGLKSAVVELAVHPVQVMKAVGDGDINDARTFEAMDAAEHHVKRGEGIGLPAKLGER